jgi:hypothetical protein
MYILKTFYIVIVLFVETPRKFITAKLSIRKPGSSSVLIICDLFNSHAFLYPRHFIDNAMKTPQSIQQKIEYQSSVCLPYIGPASHKIERILRNKAGIKVYHSSENKLFRALCTRKDSVNESQKPGVYRIPCECGLVYIGETGRNISVRLKEHKTNCEKDEQDKSAVAKHT